MGLHGRWHMCVYAWVCVHVFFFSAPRGCPSCQSCSVCAALWTEACSGRNLGRHSAPLKSFAQTRQSGTKARVQGNTRACAVVWSVYMTESDTDRGEAHWDVQSLVLLSFPSEVISIACCSYLWSWVMDLSGAEIWVSWQKVPALLFCVCVYSKCLCISPSRWMQQMVCR